MLNPLTHQNSPLLRRVLNILRLVVTVTAIAIGIELGYRGYLYFKHPNYFTAASVDAADFSVLNKSFWQYDRDHGYGYVPSLTADVTTLKAGAVIKCTQMTVANSQGNSGPPVPDFDQADVKIVVFGDSFTSAPVAGPAWTQLLGQKLERALGKTVRVLNLGRDGYGMPQMMALANAKANEIKPALIIFAFHGTALNRGRSWRTVAGTGDDMRLYTSTDSSSQPNPDDAAETIILFPSASYSWCEDHLSKPPEEQRSDPVLQKLLSKHLMIAAKNRPPVADLFDWKTSYVYGMIRYRSPFRAQWGKLLPAANPVLGYDNYRDDPRFMADLQGVMTFGAPVLFVHLALGQSISEGREFDLDRRGGKLLDELQDIIGAKVHKTTDLIHPSREDALKMCATAYDCHPSDFGMEMYAQAIATMVLKNGFR
jgi:hypothetical protein